MENYKKSLLAEARLSTNQIKKQMNNTDITKELFGEDLARRIEKRNRWTSIQEALTTSYQDWEFDVPDESSMPARPNTRIAICDDTLTVAQRAKHEYGLQNNKEAITKLLRFGLGELSYRWKDVLKPITEVEEASTTISSYLSTDDFTQSLKSETSKVDIPARQPSQQRSQQIRILWYEKQQASELSSKLSIQMTDILRCGILVAGKELGKVGDIPDPQLERLEESIGKFDKQIQRRKDRIKQLVFGGIIVAATSEHTEAVIDELQQKCPHLWEEYVTAHNEIDDMIQ